MSASAPTAPRPPAPRHDRARRRARPVVGRALLLDSAILLVLGVVALTGFAPTFSGQGYLLAGGAGLLLGTGLGLLAHRLGQPVVVLAALTVVVFFLLGGVVALHNLGGTALLPLPDTLGTLADTGVRGWKRLLTTLPPVASGPLLVLPYLMGLVSGAAGTTLAARVRLPVAPVLVPLVLLGLVILLGTSSPGRVALTAGVTVLGVIAWLALRARRLRTLRPGGHRLSRQVTAVALCLGAAGLGVLTGPVLPGLGEERVVLRTQVEPPFDVGQYPSPLVGFRAYTKGYVPPGGAEEQKLYDRELFTVDGVPSGTRVRIAALDAYDGATWRAANDARVEDGPADTFQKVGAEIAHPDAEKGAEEGGEEVTGTVTVAEAYDGVWVPTPGALTSIRFSRPDEQTASDVFRYNLATSTAVLPSGLRAGDSYAFTAVVRPPDEEEVSPADGASTGGLMSEAGARFQSLAADWAGEGTPLEQVLAVAEHLKTEGRYTDGEAPNEQYPAGHSLRRLTEFAASGGQMAGNDEQFAAMMALLAQQLGVPARVVLGAQLPDDGVVRGKDVHAWVELRVADGSWKVLDWHEFMDTERPPEQESPTPEQLVEGNVVPPPVPVRPPTTSGDPLDDSVNQRADSDNEQDDERAGWGWLVRVLLVYVGLPLLALLLVCALIVGAKAWRRHRRRRGGTPHRRLALGWREVLDHLRDFGHAAPTAATRSEQAAALARAATAPTALPSELPPSAARVATSGGSSRQEWTPAARLPALALATDVRMFAAEPPGDEAAEEYWRDVEALRREVAAAHGRWGRLRAALNLVTFTRRRHRPPRRSRRRAPASTPLPPTGGRFPADPREVHARPEGSHEGAAHSGPGTLPPMPPAAPPGPAAPGSAPAGPGPTPDDPEGFTRARR